MGVRRITANLRAGDPAALAAFYRDLFDLDVAMDMGFIVTLEAGATQHPQLSLASEGGGGQPVPDLSIEVDDLGAVEARMAGLGLTPVYGPVDEPWGVRRLMLQDPTGRLINVLVHADL